MKTYIKVSLSLALVCGVITFLLSFVNSITAPIIKEATDARAIEECSKIYICDGFEEMNVPENLKELASKIYKASDGGYVIASSGNGYGGKVVVMVGIRDGKVTGSSVLESSETEGIGSRVKEADFKDNFIDKDSETYSSVMPIAGASRSSNAYKTAVGNALAAYKELEAGK